MLSLILLLALVAVPPAHVAPGVYQAPPRCPDELLASDLSDRNVRVWLAVRKVQGNNDTAWAKTKRYADVAGKSVGATKNALSELASEGWIEEVGKRGRTPERRCVVPASALDETSRSVTNNVTDRDQSGGAIVTDGDHETSRTVTNNVTDRDLPPYGGESEQGIRTGNPSPPSVPYSGAGEMSAANPGRNGGGDRPERMAPVRPDGGVSGGELARQIAAEADEPRSREAARRAIEAELPGWRPASTGEGAVPPSVERSREDAALDEAIAELPPAERSRLTARAVRLAKRQWPGAWPGDGDPAVRQLVARLRREAFADATSATAAEEAAQP